jgi:hypothetical protein
MCKFTPAMMNCIGPLINHHKVRKHRSYCGKLKKFITVLSKKPKQMWKCDAPHKTD